MSLAPNFEVVTDLPVVIRRDFPLEDNTSLNPLSTRPYVDGEWLNMSANYKLQRGGDNNSGTADEDTNPVLFPLFVERGRYDTQAIQKATVLMLGMYEANTQIVNTTSLAIGSELTVQDISLNGVVRRGLALAGATAGRVIVGVVSKIISTGSSPQVRFVHFSNQVKP